MREPQFIANRQPHWKEFEQIMKNEKERADPDKLSNLFVQLTDDLAHAQTYYPGGRSVRYLNDLAATTYQLIYTKKRLRLGQRLAAFWSQELPAVYYTNLKYLALSFSIFLASVLIGAVSVAHDQDYLRMIVGDHYVDMTIRNILNDDPMAVYKSMHQMDMTSAIALNNLWVTGLTYSSGILFSLGPLYVLVFNGIMLGAFQFFFLHYGLLWTSFTTIWIHGTLEISAIIVAGAAGFAMGNRLAFPGTLPRLYALRVGVMEGLKMMLGIVPIIILAAFIESYITRLTDMHIVFKLFIIAGSLVYMVWFYIIHPIIRHRKHEAIATATSARAGSV